MEIVGGSTEGYSRTPSSVRPMTPNSVINSDITMVNTGRRMLSSASVIGSARSVVVIDCGEPGRTCCNPEVTTTSPFASPDRMCTWLSRRVPASTARRSALFLPHDVDIGFVETRNHGHRRHQDRSRARPSPAPRSRTRPAADPPRSGTARARAPCASPRRCVDRARRFRR